MRKSEIMEIEWSPWFSYCINGASEGRKGTLQQNKKYKRIIIKSTNQNTNNILLFYMKEPHIVCDWFQVATSGN